MDERSDSPTPGLLMVSNFISGAGGSHTYAMDLSARLQGGSWHVIRASAQATRLGRFSDMLWTTWRRRRDYEVAIVDVFSGPAFRWAEAVTRILERHDKPIVLALHGGRLPEFRREHPARVARLLSRAAAVVAPSPFLASRLGDLGTPIEILPNAIDGSRYRPRARDPQGQTLLWLRAFHPVYAPDVAVEAMALLHATHPDARLLMAGPTKDAETLARVHAAIDIHGLAGVVQVEGAVPNAEVPSWLERGDFFVNTAVVDNTPVSLLEAMATGLCVVSSDAGGIPDLIGEADSALLVPSRDAVALAEALRSLLDDPRRAAELAGRGRGQVTSMDWSKILPRWDRLLRRSMAS